MCSHLEVGTPGLCVKGRVGGVRVDEESRGGPWGAMGGFRAGGLIPSHLLSPSPQYTNEQTEAPRRHVTASRWK